MKRDLVNLTPRTAASRATSSRFFYIVESIAKGHEPTAEQLKALQRSYEATGEYLLGSPEFQRLLLVVHPHGSREIGTIIRPIHVRAEGFDIDLVARLSRAAWPKYEGERGPARLLSDLHAVLDRYAMAHRLGIKKWDRCVTLEYAGGMCADIAPIIEDPLISVAFGESHGRIPDRKLSRYEPTNPMGLVNSFNAAAKISPVFTEMKLAAESFDSAARGELAPLSDSEEVLARLLSRLVQLLKLHRNAAFGAPKLGAPNVAPQSAFITSLAAWAYAISAPQPHDTPLDLLLEIVDLMPHGFSRESVGNGGERWVLVNPAAPGHNLAEDMNTPERQQAFVAWHAKVRHDLQELLASIEAQHGFDVTLRIVRRAFGEKSAEDVRRDSVMLAPTTQKGRVITFGTLGGLASASARAHTHFGG
jgi:hypothetical protein